MEVFVNTEIEDIARALDALLVAMMEDEAKDAPVQLTALSARFANLSGPIPTRAEMELTQLLRQPVYFALRMAVRRLGERVFTVTGSTDGMREVADRIADMASKQSGRRLAMMDSAWDGVGSDSDRWWS